jgi:hypothetical protein
VEEVAAALEGASPLSARDRAAVRVARALSVVPADLRDEDRAELRRHLSEADVEWVVLAAAMMGWLNKTMDALGVPLEEPTVAEVSGVIASSGWTPGQHMKESPPAGAPPRADSFGTRISILRHAPAAIALDKQWTAGVPDRWPEVGDFLRSKTGHTFPVLSRMRHGRAIRAIATMIADNLKESVVGREAKLGAGLVYADAVRDAPLADELRALGAKELAESSVSTLARAIAPSPAAVDDGVVAACQDLSPAAIVEVVTFVALLQLLHRLSTFYA